MIKWLSKFPYKVGIHWWVFGVAYVIAAIVVILTVYIHSYRASLINPINALRHE
jgi:putative ABC transport system permease protein